MTPSLVRGDLVLRFFWAQGARGKQKRFKPSLALVGEKRGGAGFFGVGGGDRAGMGAKMGGFC